MRTTPVVLPNHLPQLVAERLTATHAPKDLLAGLEVLLEERPILASWLDSRVGDEEQLQEVLSGSYWHSNGFAKIVLYEAPTFRIRLHIWPSGKDRVGESDPHSHRWDFASTVLIGDGLRIVESLELPESDCDSDVECTRYVYDGVGLVPESKVFLRECGTFDVLTLERYTTVKTMIHTVAPKGNGLVATLLVQGPHLTSATAVYGTDLQAQGDRPGRTMNRDDVRALVSDVVAALDERG